MKGIWSWGTNKISSIRNGVSETYSSVTNGISGTYHSVTNGISATYHSATNRISDTYHSVTDGISDTYEFVSSTLDAIYTNQGLRNFVYSFTIKGWEGVSRVWDPANVTKMFHSTKTRQALKESFKANVFYYLSAAMLMEYIREQIVYAMSSTGEESEHAWLSATTAINMAFNVGLGVIMLHRNYDNTLINLTLSKVVVDENPMSHNYASCGCDDGALITAGLFSSVNLSGKLLSLWVASHVPVIKYLAPVGYAFAYGESLAEYPYSSVGMCTEHRVKALEKDNAYSLGIGSMLYGFSLMLNYGIYLKTGLSSVFISSAVDSIIYPYFVTSVLLREKPLPGDKQGMDFFYYQRQALQNLSGKISKSLMPRIMKCNNALLDYDLLPMSVLHDDDFNNARIGRIYLLETGEYVVRDYEGNVHQGLIDTKVIDLKEWNTRIQKYELKSAILKITSEAGHTPSKMKARFNYLSEHRLTKIVLWVLSCDIYGDWRSMKGLQTSPSTMLFFNAYYPLIKKQLEGIVNLRETSYVGKIVPVVPEWLKLMLLSKEYNALINFVFDEKLGNFIKATQQALEKINATQEFSQIKVKIYDKKIWDEMMVREKLGVHSLEGNKQLLLAEKPVTKPPLKPRLKSSNASQETIVRNDIIISPESKIASKPEINVENKVDVKVDVKVETKSIIEKEEAPVSQLSTSVPQLPISRSRDRLVGLSAGSKELATLGIFSEQPAVQQEVKKVIQPKRRRALHIVEEYNPEKLQINNQIKDQVHNPAQVQHLAQVQAQEQDENHNQDQPQQNRVASSPYSWKGVGGSNPSQF